MYGEWNIHPAERMAYQETSCGERDSSMNSRIDFGLWIALPHSTASDGRNN
jgi:hypothetical protein